MKIEKLAIPEVLVITPKVFYDNRGFFMDIWNKKTFHESGLDFDFVQDNHSKSSRGTLRGIHYQIENSQGKLVRVIIVFDRFQSLLNGYSLSVLFEFFIKNSLQIAYRMSENTYSHEKSRENIFNNSVFHDNIENIHFG